jgi:hypothetical protein
MKAHRIVGMTGRVIYGCSYETVLLLVNSAIFFNIENLKCKIVHVSNFYFCETFFAGLLFLDKDGFQT